MHVCSLLLRSEALIRQVQLRIQFWRMQPSSRGALLLLQVLEHGMSPLNVFLNFGDAPPLLATSFQVGSGFRIRAACCRHAMLGSLCGADAWGPHLLTLALPAFDQQWTSACCPASADLVVCSKCCSKRCFAGR